MCEKIGAEFVKEVEYYNKATFGVSPLNYSAIGCNVAKKTYLPIYAEYLYDSVMLYAKALANVTSTCDDNSESSNYL